MQVQTLLTIVSTATSGTIDYSTAYVDSTISGSELSIADSDTVTGPSVAVPFEFSLGLGLLLMLGLFGTQRGWKLWQQRQTIWVLKRKQNRNEEQNITLKT